MTNFEVREDTINFFVYVDLFYIKHHSEKSNLVKKLSFLYKGLLGRMITKERLMFLYNDPSHLLSYKILVHSEKAKNLYYKYFLPSVLYKRYYNFMCDFFATNLTRDEVNLITNEFKDFKHRVDVKSIYQKCLGKE